MSVKSLISLSLFALFALSACNQSQSGSQTTNDNTQRMEQDMTHFVGCYSIDKSLPAQIKISQESSGEFVMQMKEPEKAKTPWDKPEPLNKISVDKAWQYFEVNALSLDKSDVQNALMRPDAMMVLIKINDASQNINPLLDSPYVVYIFRGANTIYQVPCDDKPLDIIKEGGQAKIVS